MPNNIKDAYTGGIGTTNRKLLDLLNRRLKGPFTPKEAAGILSLQPKRTLRLLSYLAARGWLNRVRQGLYITVPLGTLNPSQRMEDPWIIAMSIFPPCYIGGWSACEHWGFTEQIFNDSLVITTKKQRRRKVQLHSSTYVVRWVPEYAFFGTQILWREQTKILISDPSKTIVDLVSDPYLGGGIRHTAEIIKEYFSSEHRNDTALLSYIEKQRNGAAYKRLGYIIECLKIGAPSVVDTCLTKISTGYSLLDPAIKEGGRYLRRWNLKVNATIKGGEIS